MPPSPGGDIGVLELNVRIRDLLAASNPYPIWLRGTVSGNPRPNQKGHIYFQLMERAPGSASVAATIDCALFAGARTSVMREFARAGIAFRLGEGSELRVLGRVDLWPPSGRFQFIVDSIDPSTFTDREGQLLRRLVDGLAAEGLKDRNSLLPLRSPSLKAGLVTAPGSAAMEDFVATLRESGYPFEVVICPSPMQGESTSAGVVHALAALARVPDISVIVLTRGGGSGSDLSWFNDEAIGRAIATCPVPVISGIGHEVDFTLPDFVCHTRAKTPTHAAAILVDLAATADAGVSALARSLASGALPRLQSGRSVLESLARDLARSVRYNCMVPSREIARSASALRSAVDRRAASASEALDMRRSGLSEACSPGWLDGKGSRIDRWAAALPVSSFRMLEDRRLRLELLDGNVSARSPERMMSLGWSLVRDSSGRILKSAGEASAGDELEIDMSDGVLDARVENVRERE